MGGGKEGKKGTAWGRRGGQGRVGNLSHPPLALPMGKSQGSKRELSRCTAGWLHQSDRGEKEEIRTRKGKPLRNGRPRRVKKGEGKKGKLAVLTGGGLSS